VLAFHSSAGAHRPIPHSVLIPIRPTLYIEFIKYEGQIEKPLCFLAQYHLRSHNLVFVLHVIVSLLSGTLLWKSYKICVIVSD
jgi:hypothetical protein